MNEDYLWNRTGEIDEDVAGLEDLFQELRFDPSKTQPPHLEPNVLPIQRWYFPRLAIAASIGFLLLAGTLAILKFGGWFVRHDPKIAINYAPPKVTAPASTAPTPIPKSPDPKESGPPERKEDADNKRSGNRVQREASRRRSSNEIARMREGERAKNELMAAFRIASAKLNFVQHKLTVNKEVRPPS